MTEGDWMNLFYEDYPETVKVSGRNVRIVTDFREYIRLHDALQDDKLTEYQKYLVICEYFLGKCVINEVAIKALTEFMSMEQIERAGVIQKSDEEEQLYSFSIDFPYILSAFIHVYGINLQTVRYMHWWKFRTLFDGLPENTEIKQRIMYRSIDLSMIKDKEERKRIRKIQMAIQLPKKELSDYDIGNAFM